jgi:hypothetical protein
VVSHKSYSINSIIYSNDFSNKVTVAPSVNPTTIIDSKVPILYFESGLTFSGLLLNDLLKRIIKKSYAYSLNISETYVSWSDNNYMQTNLKKRLQNVEIEVFLSVNISLDGIYENYINNPYLLYSLLTSNLLKNVNTNVLLNYIKTLISGLNLGFLNNIAILKVENSPMMVINAVNVITDMPTDEPTTSPTTSPSELPSNCPTTSPTEVPTFMPSVKPTTSPSTSPTGFPSNYPTTSPTEVPTFMPSVKPTTSPTTSPSGFPSNYPTTSPSGFPSNYPTTSPSGLPSLSPSYMPSTIPSLLPSPVPTIIPSDTPVFTSLKPSSISTLRPSVMPSLDKVQFNLFNVSSDPTISRKNADKLSNESISESRKLAYIFLGLFLFMSVIASLIVLRIVKVRMCNRNRITDVENKETKKNGSFCKIEPIADDIENKSSEKRGVESIDSGIVEIKIE